MGKQDIIYAGGADVEHWTMSILFDAMGALSAKYNDNPQLGAWVDGQRQQKRQGKLSSKRIQKLEAIGFQWTLIKSH